MKTGGSKILMADAAAVCFDISRLDSVLQIFRSLPQSRTSTVVVASESLSRRLSSSRIYSTVRREDEWEPASRRDPRMPTVPRRWFSVKKTYRSFIGFKTRTPTNRVVNSYNPVADACITSCFHRRRLGLPVFQTNKNFSDHWAMKTRDRRRRNNRIKPPERAVPEQRDGIQRKLAKFDFSQLFINA